MAFNKSFDRIRLNKTYVLEKIFFLRNSEFMGLLISIIIHRKFLFELQRNLFWKWESQNFLDPGLAKP